MSQTAETPTGRRLAAGVVEGVSAATAALDRVRPRYVLAALIAVEWIVVFGIAQAAAHRGWIYYQGGDQLWYYTAGWLLAHGHFPVPVLGYLWSAALAPIALVAGPNLLQALPAVILVNVLILMPIAMLALYGIANRIAGRLFAYWTLALWIVIPILGAAYTNTGYHERYTDLVLPQALGLTAMADFPVMVATLVSAYFAIRVVLDERPSALDAVGAGAAAGAAIAIKPSAALFLVGPPLALVASRRVKLAGVAVVGLAPALLTLAVWKWRHHFHVPVASREGSSRLALGTGHPSIGSILPPKYFSADWGHLSRQLDLLREHFWSGRLIEWLVLAGAIALARRSLRASLVVVGWFAAYVVAKGLRTVASVEDTSLFRLLIPAFPAFLILIASVPFLLPTRGIRRAPREPKRIVPVRWRAAALATAIVATALVPFAAIALAAPARGPNPATVFLQGPPIPINLDFGLHAHVTEKTVRLTWRAQHSVAGPGFYLVYRTSGPNPDFICLPAAAAQRCNTVSVELGDTYYTSYVDRPGPGTWQYRVGLAANWLDAPGYGNVYIMSTLVQAAVEAASVRPSPAQPVVLYAVVGPGPEISLTSPDESPPYRAGAFNLSVAEQSTAYHFHLRGPGVDRVFSIGTVRVTLKPGTYVYFPDGAPTPVRHTFTVVK